MDLYFHYELSKEERDLIMASLLAQHGHDIPMCVHMLATFLVQALE